MNTDNFGFFSLWHMWLGIQYMVSEVDCLLFAGLSGNLQYMSRQWDVHQDQSNSSRDGATNSNTMQRLWWKWRKNIRYLQHFGFLSKGNLETIWVQLNKMFLQGVMLLKSSCCMRNMLRTTLELCNFWALNSSAWGLGAHLILKHIWSQRLQIPFTQYKTPNSLGYPF